MLTSSGVLANVWDIVTKSKSNLWRVVQIVEPTSHNSVILVLEDASPGKRGARTRLGNGRDYVITDRATL